MIKILNAKRYEREGFIILNGGEKKEYFFQSPNFSLSFSSSLVKTTRNYTRIGISAEFHPILTINPSTGLTLSRPPDSRYSTFPITSRPHWLRACQDISRVYTCIYIYIETRARHYVARGRKHASGSLEESKAGILREFFSRRSIISAAVGKEGSSLRSKSHNWRGVSSIRR